MVYNSNGVCADFAKTEAIIHPLERGPLEDLDRVLERDAVTCSVLAILLWDPKCGS